VTVNILRETGSNLDDHFWNLIILRLGSLHVPWTCL